MKGPLSNEGMRSHHVNFTATKISPEERCTRPSGVNVAAARRLLTERAAASRAMKNTLSPEEQDEHDQALLTGRILELLSNLPHDTKKNETPDPGKFIDE